MSATTHFLALFHCLACFHPHRTALQMCQQTIFTFRMFDEHGISRHATGQPIHPKCSDTRRVSNSVAGLDHDTVSRRENRLIKTTIIFELATVAFKGAPILPMLDQVVGKTLAWDAPGMRGFFCDAAIEHAPFTVYRQNVIHFLLVLLR